MKLVKNKKKSNVNVPVEKYITEDKIHNVDIGSYNRHGMQLFGVNVQLARAIPNILDGFKPSARRCLYATARIAKADKKFKKVNAIKGQIIQIHPHGDISVEQTLLAMGKEWELAYPLIDVPSNNGSPKGDPSAAGRYLDAKLTDYAYDCYFKEWDDALVDMKPSYNPEFNEPVYLISKFPDLLLRPTTGFTFGMASNIPSYNLNEAFSAVIELIKDPKYDPILLPDMPCGGIILDEGQFEEIDHTGQGTFRMRAEIEIDEAENAVVIESIPYKIKLDDIVDKINQLRSSALSSLTDIQDTSDINGVGLVLKFAEGTDLKQMVSKLYKKTNLEYGFAVQMTYVDMNQGKVVLYNLKEIMQSWIDNRRVIKRKYFINRMIADKERLHVTDILIEICEDQEFLDNIIHLIRESERDEIVKALMERFPQISSTQATKFAAMRISELSKTAYSEYVANRIRLNNEIEELEDKINHPKKIDKDIIKEIEDAIKKYSKPRKCRIEVFDEEKEVKNEITNSKHLIVTTKLGYVKKMKAGTRDCGELSDGDEPETVLNINNIDSLVLFDTGGYIHTIRVSDIPVVDKKSIGISLNTFINIRGKIISVLPLSKITKKSYFFFITKKGMIKKTAADKFSFGNSVIAIRLKDGDSLVQTLHAKKNANIMIYTLLGEGTRFDTSSVKETARNSMGVIGIDLTDKDEVVGMCEVDEDDKYVFIMTEKGCGKVFSLNTFTTQSRRGSVLILATLPKNDYICEAIPCKRSDKFLAVLKGNTIEMDFSDIPKLTRTHQCKKLIPVAKGEKIIRVVKM